MPHDRPSEPLDINRYSALLTAVFKEEQLSMWISENLSAISPRWLRFLASYYPDARIRRACLIQSGVELGDDTYPNYGIYVLDLYNHPSPPKLLSIGARVAMGPRITFVCDTRPNIAQLMQLEDVAKRMVKTAPIIVEDDVWIGTGATLLPGVRVSRMSIVGAHSLVRDDVPPFSVVAGCPARIVRRLEGPPSANAAAQILNGARSE